MTGRLILLAAVLALVALFVDFGGDDPSPDADAADEAQPGYYLREAVVTEFGEDGAIRLEVKAATATEDTRSRVIQLAGVELDYRARPEQHWHLTADEGQVAEGNRKVALAGNVIMTGQPADGQLPAIVRTPRLELDTQAQTASTDAEVMLDFGRHALRARGLLADLKAETLQLESSVNGRFLP